MCIVHLSLLLVSSVSVFVSSILLVTCKSFFLSLGGAGLQRDRMLVLSLMGINVGLSYHSKSHC